MILEWDEGIEPPNIAFAAQGITILPIPQKILADRVGFEPTLTSGFGIQELTN